MIAEPSQKLIVLLAVLTLLGVVMGYCFALLVTKRKLQSVISAERARLEKEISINQSDLQLAQDSITVHRVSDNTSISVSDLAQAQTKRIRRLETQLRELQMAGTDGETHADTLTLPTLSRRANGQQSTRGIPVLKSGDTIQALSRDLEIPTLAESEVPDSEEDLELDLFGKTDGRAAPRG